MVNAEWWAGYAVFRVDLVDFRGWIWYKGVNRRLLIFGLIRGFCMVKQGIAISGTAFMLFLLVTIFGFVCLLLTGKMVP